MNKQLCSKIKNHEKTVLNSYAYLIILFLLIVIFLLIVQPIDIYNMKSHINKGIIIFLLSINYVSILLLEIYFLLKRIRINNGVAKIHVLFSIGIIFTSILILYVRHPFMTKHHLFPYLNTTTIIVSIFQLLTYNYIISKLIKEKGIKSNSTISKINISDNKTTLNIDIKNLFYIKSEGNYVTVFEKNKKYLIRSSLKKIIEQNNNSELIRCHKSYIVNSNKIKSISGNSKGYKISLLDKDFEIPASIKVGEKLKNKMK